MALFWKKKSNTSAAGSNPPRPPKGKERRASFLHPKIYPAAPLEKPSFSFDINDLSLPLLIVALGLLFWFVFLSPFFKVKYIFVEGEISRDVTEILKNLKGKNIFLLRVSKFEKNLEKQEPRVKGLHLVKGIPDTLRLKLEERSQVLAWQTQGEVYLLDKEGVVFSKPNLEEAQNLLPVVDRRNLPVNLGQKVVASYFVEFTRRLLEEVPFRTSQKIKSLAVDETTFTLEATLDSKIKAIFDINTSLDNQVSALAQVLQNQGGDIKEYADVRVEGKVFYK